MAQRKRQFAAVLLAVACLFTGSLAAAPAGADTGRVITGTTSAISATELATLSTQRPLNLSLHKSGPEFSTDARTWQNVSYTITRLQEVDLTQVSGWNQVETLTLAAAQTMPKAESFTGQTDANGDVTFSKIPMGVYVVHETKPAGAPPEFESSADQLIAMPSWDQLHNTWGYDVALTMKNQPNPSSTDTTPITEVPPGNNGTPTQPANVPTDTSEGIVKYVVPVLATIGVLQTVSQIEAVSALFGSAGSSVPFVGCPNCVPASQQTPVKQPAPVTKTPAQVLDKIGHTVRNLASTGANVLWVLFAAVLMIGLGGFLLIWRRSKRDQQET